MKLIDRLSGVSQERDSGPSLSLSEYMNFYSTGGNLYNLTQTWTQGKEELPPNDFRGYADVATHNGVFFACLLVRLSLFSEARFLWRKHVNGRPADLFGTSDLRILERPDRNVTTGGLIGRMEQDSSLAGNAYNARIGDRIVRLRPDWVQIVMTSPNGPADNPVEDPEVSVLGYVFGKPGADRRTFFPAEEVSHFAPIPDPTAAFRGMSWMTPVLRELDADNQATDFKSQWFRNSATPNMVVTADKTVSVDEFMRIMDAVEANHTGSSNAFKTLYLAGGADAKIVGSNFEQMSFKAVQAAGETRIAAASGVPPVIVGLSEGLGAATYSNYSQARRRLADGTARPWWREAAASLETLVKSPGPDALLSYDDRDIAFLRDDAKDVAEIQQSQAQAIRTLIDAGWKPDAAVDAVISDDMARLTGNHSGLTSAQLLPPAEADPTLNGNGVKQVAPPKPAALTS